ncbi:MAG: gluconeogenesis factor YvcK family protein [bacterium]
MTKNSQVVAIGGGTGTFTLLTGLKEYKNLDISAVVTMADDGGSNKVLRDEFGLLPTSGIRQSVIALSQDTTLLRRLFEYRFYQGTGISGMTFGNLFMAAVADIVGSQQDAIAQTCELLGVRGHVLPVSYEHTSLVATYQDGTEVLGEHYIDMSNPKVAKQRIVNLRSIPQIKIDELAKKAIISADVIILGPGDLYTNTVANLIVRGVREAIEGSHAKLVFIMNLMNRTGETYGYRASDFLADLSQYLSPDRLDFILINSDLSLSSTILKKYLAEGSSLVEDDLESTWHRAQIIRTKLLSHHAPPRQKGDKLVRSMARHDPTLLAKAIYEL